MIHKMRLTKIFHKIRPTKIFHKMRLTKMFLKMDTQNETFTKILHNKLKSLKVAQKHGCMGNDVVVMLCVM